MNSKHSNSNFAPVIPMSQEKCQRFQLVHPFTCIVAGMTGSGKTTWVQSLLQQAQTVIDQPPKRIIWCYSQWQLAFTQLLMMIPTIEFVKGIPESLENDSYLDVNMRNLIVIDDQIIEAGKDNRVVNLFTKGLHHRNLSVIYIVQNLFHQGKGNRSISLNSHYLVLFKNPRDKLQILTLAKQMYPRETAWFVKEYKRRCEDHLDIFLWISGQRLQIDVDCEQMFYPAKKDSTRDSKRIKFPKNCSSTSNNKL